MIRKRRSPNVKRSADFRPHFFSRHGRTPAPRIRILLPLILFSLACNTVTRLFEPTPVPATVTPQPLAPLYVPPGCEAVPLATVPAATQLAQPAREPTEIREISQEVQLRVFDSAVDRIEDVYIYPDFNGRDWPAIVAAHRANVEAGLDTGAFYDEMQLMVQDLGDEHSGFESPAEVAVSEAELAGTKEYVGIGVSVMPQGERDEAVLVLVFDGSPAEHSGLEPHDSILAVDGLMVVDGDELLTQRLRGPECSAARVTVRSPGEAPRDVLILRQRISGGVPVEARLVPTTDGSRIGYIMLPSFFDQTIPQKVEAALNEFGELDGLILDNRMNGGGSSSVLEPILSYFTSGTLGSFKSRNESRPLVVNPHPIRNSQTVPLVILVGEDTVSFGEIFSGALRDTGRAMIVGETTLGNVETLHGYSFEDGSRLWIAEETFDPAISHADWETTGIIPDVEAFAPWDTFTFENDPAVAAAVTLLGHQ